MSVGISLGEGQRALGGGVKRVMLGVDGVEVEGGLGEGGRVEVTGEELKQEWVAAGVGGLDRGGQGAGGSNASRQGAVGSNAEGQGQGADVQEKEEEEVEKGRRWTGGVPCLMRGGGEGEDGWVGGLNGLLKFNYAFGEEG